MEYFKFDEVRCNACFKKLERAREKRRLGNKRIGETQKKQHDAVESGTQEASAESEWYALIPVKRFIKR